MRAANQSNVGPTKASTIWVFSLRDPLPLVFMAQDVGVLLGGTDTDR
jgi:hypothetical protein